MGDLTGVAGPSISSESGGSTGVAKAPSISSEATGGTGTAVGGLLGSAEMAGGTGFAPVKGMIEHYKMVQDADRPLLIRGSLTEDEVRLVLDSLDPRGLYLHIMPQDKKEIDALRPILGMS